MRTRRARTTRAALSLYLAVAVLVIAAAPATAKGLDILPNPTLGKEYQEMNLKISQVHVASSIPFVQLSPSQRVAHMSGYVTDLRGRRFGKVASSLSADFSKGSLVSEVGVELATSIFTRMAEGATMDESIEATWNYVASSEFVFGQLICGIGGAVVGALIPVPLVGGIAGQILSTIPMVAGASLGGQLGYGAVEGFKQGRFDLLALLKSVDYIALTCQSIGSAAGMVLGAFLPVPGLGPVIGGVIGGNLGLKLAGWLRQKCMGAAAEAAERPADDATEGSGTTEVAVTTTATTATAATPAELQARRDQAYRAYVAAEASGDRDQARTALELLYQADGALTAVR